MQIVPQIVSRPGKDILEGVDALVKDGIADPDHLTIGGYSYGGYMTNWLITQTTRFKAAVTGAGAVEHIGNWGNDDTTYDDAYFLGGRPWEAAQRYHDEAAIFQIDKVKTPTHMVAGANDIRVAVLEDYLARTRAVLAWHSQQPAHFPRRRPRPWQESLARQDQSTRRGQLDREILCVPGEMTRA